MKNLFKNLVPVLAVLFTPVLAGAQSMALPGLDSVIMTVRQDITGFWAYSIVILSFVGAGVGYAFGESGGVVKKLGGIVMGGAIALGATQLVTTLYSGSGSGLLVS